MSIPVTDPFGVAGDRTMPTLELALDPSVAQQQLGRRLSRLAGRDGCVHVRAIRVTRYKPGRRCVIEYDVDVRRPDAEPESVVLVGKVRVRRYGKSGYRLLDAFWHAGSPSQSEPSEPSACGFSAKCPAAPRPTSWRPRRVSRWPA